MVWLHSMLRWLVLPLLHSVTQTELIDALLPMSMPALIGLLRSMANRPLPSAAVPLHADLLRYTAACELFAAMMGRLGTTARNALNGCPRDGAAAGSLALLPGTFGVNGTPVDLFTELVGVLRALVQKPLQLPTLADEADRAVSVALARAWAAEAVRRTHSEADESASMMLKGRR